MVKNICRDVLPDKLIGDFFFIYMIPIGGTVRGDTATVCDDLSCLGAWASLFWPLWDGRNIPLPEGLVG